MVKLFSRLHYPKLIGLALAVDVVGIGIVIFLSSKYLPPQLPLFYGRSRGEEQLAAPILLIVPLLVSLVIVFLNSIASIFLSGEFIKKVLIITALVVNLFCLVTLTKVILLVGAF